MKWESWRWKPILALKNHFVAEKTSLWNGALVCCILINHKSFRVFIMCCSPCSVQVWETLRVWLTRSVNSTWMTMRNSSTNSNMVRSLLPLVVTTMVIALHFPQSPPVTPMLQYPHNIPPQPPSVSPTRQFHPQHSPYVPHTPLLHTPKPCWPLLPNFVNELSHLCCPPYVLINKLKHGKWEA